MDIFQSFPPTPSRFSALALVTLRCDSCQFRIAAAPISAHIRKKMAGHFRASLAAATAPPSKSFPDRPQFSGFMKPCRFEGEVRNLEIAGTVPTELDGTFYRVMPDPQFPPFIDNDPVSLNEQ